MTTHSPDFELDRPAALIAALPAVLGFVPENSLVLVSLGHGELGAVMRVDLGAELIDRVEHLVEVAAAAEPEAVIAVIVDADGADCPQCNEDYRQLCTVLAEALSQNDIELWAAHVVDRVAVGGRWRCVDGCGAGGEVDDPSASPLAAAAVLEGRRLYPRRADLQAVIAVDDPSRSDELAGALTQHAARRDAAHEADPLGCGRRDVEHAMAAAARLAGGQPLPDAELAELGCALNDVQVRDTLYALAVSETAGEAEALWALLARTMPRHGGWRRWCCSRSAPTSAATGRWPECRWKPRCAAQPDHRMAGMLDTALQCGLRPEQIRELAVTGYRMAKRLGVRLPPRRAFGRRAG